MFSTINVSTNINNLFTGGGVYDIAYSKGIWSLTTTNQFQMLLPSWKSLKIQFQRFEVSSFQGNTHRPMGIVSISYLIIRWSFIRLSTFRDFLVVFEIQVDGIGELMLQENILILSPPVGKNKEVHHSFFTLSL